MKPRVWQQEDFDVDRNKFRAYSTYREVCNRTGISFPTAKKGMDALIKLGIARELTGQQRNRVFVYDKYISILNEGTEPL
jgi:hypothetical protein